MPGPGSWRTKTLLPLGIQGWGSPGAPDEGWTGLWYFTGPCGPSLSESLSLCLAPPLLLTTESRPLFWAALDGRPSSQDSTGSGVGPSLVLQHHTGDPGLVAASGGTARPALCRVPLDLSPVGSQPCTPSASLSLGICRAQSGFSLPLPVDTARVLRPPVAEEVSLRGVGPCMPVLTSSLLSGCWDPRRADASAWLPCGGVLGLYFASPRPWCLCWPWWEALRPWPRLTSSLLFFFFF